MEAYLAGLFVAFVWGGCAGIWLQKKAMHNIMRIKSRDGTCEYISRDEYVYIMNGEDYRRIVLGIDNDPERT